MPLPRFLCVGLLLAAVPWTSSPLHAANDDPATFDIPAGDAAETLRVFAAQAHRQLLFSAGDVEGVNTNPVHGQEPPAAALTAMLVGTELRAVMDPRSGAFTVVRRRGPPPTETVPKPADVTSSADEESVVQMSAVNVSTSLGNYAETTASTGTKVPMSLLETPSTVQVLNASFLNDRNAESLDDVYNYVLGMSRVSGGATDFTLRGFTSHGAGLNLHNLEIDGMPGLTTRFGSPNTANIERVEVLKGPASLLYGLATPGGMVNLVTKSPQPNFQASIETSASTFAGFDSSFGDKMSYTGTVDVTGPIDSNQHWLYRVIARADDDNSFRDNDFNQNQYLYPSLTFAPTADTTITFKVEILRQKRLADYVGLVVPFNNLAYLPAYNTNYNNPTDIERDLGQAFTATIEQNLPAGWKLTINSRDANNINGRRLLDYSSLKSVLPVQNSTLIRTYRDFVDNNNRVDYGDVNANGNLGPAWLQNTVLVGVSCDVDLVGLTRTAQGPTVPAIPIYETAAPVPYPADGASQTNTRGDYYTWSGYFSDHLRIGDRLLPSFGVRYDYQDGTSVDLIAHSKVAKNVGDAVPNAGLVYLLSSSLSAYASYCGSFFPNSLTAYNAANQQGFDPQTATQAEAGLKAEWLGGTLSSTVSAYQIQMKNVLESTPYFTPQGNAISQLDGRQRSQGVEWETSWLVVPNWQVTAGISYLDAKVTASDSPALVNSRLPNVPHTTGNFWTRYNVPGGFLKGFGIGLGVTYEGDYTTSIAGLSIPGHTLVDNALYYQWRRTKIALNVENTLDAKYIASQSQDLDGVWPGNPRQFTLSVQTRL